MNNYSVQKIYPPLRWAGGKRWFVKYLQSTWFGFQENRLVEPFCGGLSIALGLNPKKALLNDINPHLINFYQWLQKGFVLDRNYIFKPENYYFYRETFNNLITNSLANTQDGAALFFYLNRTCFNGLCRFNKEGKFNVPIGKLKTYNYSLDMESYKERFSSWVFSVGTFKNIVLSQNDFIFADPPYDVDFRNYSKDSFYWQDQEELIEWLSNHQGPIVLCNSATQRILDMYRSNGYELSILKERIFIKANGDRTPANVVIATKNISLPFPLGVALSGESINLEINSPFLESSEMSLLKL
jgi:DNA adenine methylase